MADTLELLKRLEPLSALSIARLNELSELCEVERIRSGSNPFSERGISGFSVYLVSGRLQLVDATGRVETLAGSAEAARFPIGKKGPLFVEARAMGDCELLRVDDELVDIMVTWDQLAGFRSSEKIPAVEPPVAAAPGNSTLPGIFSINNLRNGVFAALPSAHIAELLARFKPMLVKRAQVVVREGEAGRYYYLIENGKAQVTRHVGGVEVSVAELRGGDAFGEEALLSGDARNATVTMKTDGVLLRLRKGDFEELLKEPLLSRIGIEQARRKVADGAVWIDVRYPAEFRHGRIPGAINIPLGEVRGAARLLDKRREYVVYCQTGLRSSAAAFLLAQRGCRAYLLDGGLRGSEAGR